MPDGILIIGAGGHGKVVADAILLKGGHLAGFLDDHAGTIGTTVMGLPVLGKSEEWQRLRPSGLIVAIGDNGLRQSMVDKVESGAHSPPWTSVIHPRAVVSSSAEIGAGTVIMAGTVINPETHIGRHTIINTSATVDHDCAIGDYTHIAPGAHLAGSITVGDHVVIGVGASILPGCHIGSNAIVGAGAVVLGDVAPGVTVIGVPARILRG